MNVNHVIPAFKPSHVRFVVDRVVMGRVFSEVLPFLCLSLAELSVSSTVLTL
jgi:hypothetical protein